MYASFINETATAEKKATWIRNHAMWMGTL